MPKIFPFKGGHFDTARTADLSAVVTQPYDKIDAAQQEQYYARDEHNYVRLIRRKEEAGDKTGQLKYPAAARTLEEWFQKGILVEDPAPAFYVYYQTYQTPQGERTRKGLMALVRADAFGKGRVHPHEETHSGPKIDRFNLLTNVRAHLEHVFLLYSDPEKKVQAVLEEAARREPDFKAKDDLGETHRVWRIKLPESIRFIQKDLEHRDAIVADGHHRYETAVRYREEMSKKKLKVDGDAGPDNVLATLVNMDDEGLTIYGTHRVLHDVPGFDRARLEERVRKLFDIREYAFAGPEEERSAREDLLEDLRLEGLARPTFGVAFPGVSSYFTYVLRDRRAALELMKKEKRSDDWKSIDVNILHAVILEGMLGIGRDKLDREECVSYFRHLEEVQEALRKPGAQAAFLVNPVRLDAIRRVVRKGERFSQKTTDFYPKMISGLVFCRLHFQES